MAKYTGRGLVVKRPGVLSKVQMLNLVLGVGVFSLLPIVGFGNCQGTHRMEVAVRMLWAVARAPLWAVAPATLSFRNENSQKTVPGRVRVKFAQNGGHEKATKKPRKSNEKGPNTVFLDKRATKKPRFWLKPFWLKPQVSSSSGWE